MGGIRQDVAPPVKHYFAPDDQRRESANPVGVSGGRRDGWQQIVDFREICCEDYGVDTPILDFVRQHLDAYLAGGGSLAPLARKVGVQYSWLRMFAGGHIPNPGVLPMQKLADHFAGVSRESEAA